MYSLNRNQVLFLTKEMTMYFLNVFSYRSIPVYKIFQPFFIHRGQAYFSWNLISLNNYKDGRPDSVFPQINKGSTLCYPNSHWFENKLVQDGRCELRRSLVFFTSLSFTTIPPSLFFYCLQIQSKIISTTRRNNFYFYF